MLPEDDPTSIGNILVSMNVITEDELAEYVSKFRAVKEELLGEFICKESVGKQNEVTRCHIQIAIIKQKQLRGESGQNIVTKMIELSKIKQQKVHEGIDDLLNKAKLLADTVS